MPAATTNPALTGFGLGWGISKEPSFGVATSTFAFIPFTSESIKESWSMNDVRHTQNRFTHQTLNRGRKSAGGDVSLHVEPETIGYLLYYIFGKDSDVPVVIPHGTPVSTTTNGSVSAGATSVTLTSATGLAANDYIVIESGTAKAELVKITSIATNTLTIPALKFAHSSGVAVNKSIGEVLKHVFTPQLLVESFTSQFKYGQATYGKEVTGTTMTGLTLEFGDDLLTASASVAAKEVYDTATPTTPTFDANAGRVFTFRDITIDIGSVTGAQVNVTGGSVQISHEAFTEDYRQGSDTVGSIPAGYFSAEGNLDFVMNSAADANLDPWFRGTAGSDKLDVVITYTGDVVVGSTYRQIKVTLPRTMVLEAGPAVSVGERIMRTVSFKTFHDETVSGAGKNVSVELINKHVGSYGTV